MEGLLLLVFALLLFFFIGSIRAFVAGSQIARQEKELANLRFQVKGLTRRLKEAEEALPAPEEAEEPAAAEAEPEEEEREVAPPPRERKPLPTPMFGPPIEERTPTTTESEPEPVEEPAPASEPTPAPVLASPKPVAAPAQPRRDWGEWIEEVVGKRWMTYAGGLALFVSVGFFVKYAIDVGWIGPALRVGAGVAFGAAILALGDWLARRGMRTFGLGLIGAAGLPVLYVSLFAGFQFYDLIPQWMSFVAMVLVTTVGMVLAIRHDSIVVSLLSLVGGLLTPMLVSTGQDSRDTLFGYLLILDLGVLGIAFRRQWRSLDVLAFLGTGAYYALWFTKFYVAYDNPPMVAALAWLGVFYATFLILPFAWHLASRTTATLERFVMGLAVAAAVFWVAYEILHPVHRHALGIVALVMAGSYATLGVLVRARLAEDRKAVFAFLAFAMTFLTIAGPLHFRLNGITIAWSAEAVLLLWLGFKYRYLPVRLGGTVVLALAVGRLFVRHWPLHDGPYALLATSSFAVAAFVCAAVAAFAIVHASFRDRAGVLDEGTRRVIGLLAGLLPLFVLHHEFGDWFSLREGALPAYAFRTTGGAVYGIGALLFLGFGLRRRSVTARLASVGVLGIGTLILLSTYPGGFPSAIEPFANARYPVAMGLAVSGVLIGWIISRPRELFEPMERGLGEGLTLVAALGLVAATAVDLWHPLREISRYAALIGQTALFAGSAGTFFLLAWRFRSAAWRGASLALLVLATGTGFISHQTARPEAFLHFFNTRFAVGLLVALSWIWQGERTRRRPDGFRPVTNHDGAVPGFVGAVLALLVLSADLGSRLAQIGPDESRSGLALLWAAGSLAVLFAGLREKEPLWRAGSLLLLFTGVVMSAVLYSDGTNHDRTFFLSLPWGTVALVSAAAFAWGTWQRMEPRVGEGARCGAALLLLFVTNFELFYCLGFRVSHYAAWCGVVVLNAVAAAGFAVAGRRLSSFPWRFLALLSLGTTLLMGPWLFGPGMEREFVIFANGRFVALVLAVAATFAVGRLLVTAGEHTSDGERKLGRFLQWLTALLMFLVLSAEAWLYSKQQAADPQQARFATQMALSVSWSVYAVAMLALGFRFRLRPLRLVALGLFAITVGKLVIVDLAAVEQEQVFRILSFFVAGVLMIGGSFLYHRVEKLMEKQWEE